MTTVLIVLGIATLSFVLGFFYALETNKEMVMEAIVYLLIGFLLGFYFCWAYGGWK